MYIYIIVVCPQNSCIPISVSHVIMEQLYCEYLLFKISSSIDRSLSCLHSPFNCRSVYFLFPVGWRQKINIIATLSNIQQFHSWLTVSVPALANEISVYILKFPSSFLKWRFIFPWNFLGLYECVKKQLRL